MAKIILIAPPYLDLYGNLSRAAGRYFPLGLAYVASYLIKYGGHQVELYEPEAQGLSTEALARIIREGRPDVVGLTSSTPNFPRAIDLARIAKQSAPEARVVLGGVHASAVPEFIVQNYGGAVDYVVVGEGEETMLELVAAIERGSSVEGIRGLVYASGGKPFRTPVRPYIEDLDRIPWPARHLVPQELFFPNAHNARHKRSATVLTSRGCPFNCSFCAARLVSGQRYRTHSAEYVLEEMAMLKRDYGVRQLVITDDTFTLNKPRLREVCEGMIRQKMRLEWFCFSQVNAVDRETLALMKRAGCYNIGFGVESASPEILKAMGKNINPEDAVKTVATANSLGMKTQAFYVFGSPGETRAQMEATVELSMRVNATLTFFNMLVPYPGTREFEHYFGQTPLEEINWEDFVAVGEKCVLSAKSDITPKEVEQLIARANKRYYSHPLRLLNIARHIRTPYELSNYLSGALGFARQISRWAQKN